MGLTKRLTDLQRHIHSAHHPQLGHAPPQARPPQRARAKHARAVHAPLHADYMCVITSTLTPLSILVLRVLVITPCHVVGVQRRVHAQHERVAVAEPVEGMAQLRMMRRMDVPLQARGVPRVEVVRVVRTDVRHRPITFTAVLTAGSTSSSGFPVRGLIIGGTADPVASII